MAESDSFEAIQSPDYDEDVQREVYERLKRGDANGDIAEDVDPSLATIGRWAKAWGFGDQPKEETESRHDQGGQSRQQDDAGLTLDFGSMGMTAVERDKGVDFGAMRPGEFIGWFFEEDLDEMSVNNLDLLIRKCNTQSAIPTESQMMEILRETSSGISNATEIKWIAEDYWAHGRKYASRKLGVSESEIVRKVNESGGNWVRIVNNPSSGRSRGLQSGGTVSFDGRERREQEDNRGGGNGFVSVQESRNGRDNHGGRGSGDSVVEIPSDGGRQDRHGRANGGGSSGQDVQTQQVLQQQMEMMKQMQQQHREEMRSMREDMMTSQRANHGGNQTAQGGDNLVSQLREMAQAKETMEMLVGDDGNGSGEVDQMVTALQHELRQLADKIESDDTPNIDMGSASSEAALVSALAQREDIDGSVISHVVENISSVESDPDVKEKELEKDMKQMELKQKHEFWGNALDGVSDTVEGVLDMFADGDSPVEQLAAAQSNGHADQQTQQPQGGQAGSHAGYGEGAGVRTDQSPQGEQRSPAQRMIERSRQEADQEANQEVTEESHARVKTEAHDVEDQQQPDRQPELEPADQPERSEPYEQESGDDDEFVCEECGESFPTEMGLRGHMNKHSGGRGGNTGDSA
jgi:hypothetical protein